MISTPMILLVFSLVLANGAADRHAPLLPVIRVTDSPTIDGELGEKAWCRSFRVSEFRFAAKGKGREGAQPSRPATMRLLYTDDCLYVGFECAGSVKDGGRIPSRAVTGRTRTLPRGPGLTIFLQPGPGGEVFRFATAGDGKTDDGQPRNKDRKGRPFGVVRGTDASWTAEFEIPFASLRSATPADGSEWRLSAAAHDAVSNGEIRWPGEATGAAAPRRFGRILFLKELPRALSVRLTSGKGERVCYISPLDVHAALPSVAPARNTDDTWSIPLLEFPGEGRPLKAPAERIGVLAKYDYIGWFGRSKAYPVNSGCVDLRRAIFRGGAPSKGRDPRLMLERLKALGVRKIIILCNTEQGVSLDEQIALMNELGIAWEKFSWRKLVEEKKRGGREPTWERLKKIILAGNVYVQCVWGCDRTGGVIGRLRTEFYGWTKREAQIELTVYGFAGNLKRSELYPHHKERLWYFDFPVSEYEPMPHLDSPNPMAPVVRVERGPEVDGRLDDRVWRRAFTLFRFRPTRKIADVPSPRVRHQTTMKLLYTAEALYLGFDCVKNVPAGEPVPYKAEKRQRDGHCWRDDSVSLFLQPDLTGDEYFLFITTVLGDVYDGKLRSNEWNSTAWKSAAGKTPTGWSVEFEIPFAALGVEPPAEGDVWGLSPVRNEAAFDEPSAWAPISWNWHQKSRFGRCVFLRDVPENFAVEIVDARGRRLFSRMASDVAKALAALRPPSAKASRRAGP